MLLSSKIRLACWLAALLTVALSLATFGVIGRLTESNAAASRTAVASLAHNVRDRELSDLRRLLFAATADRTAQRLPAEQALRLRLELRRFEQSNSADPRSRSSSGRGLEDATAVFSSAASDVITAAERGQRLGVKLDDYRAAVGNLESKRFAEHRRSTQAAENAQRHASKVIGWWSLALAAGAAALVAILVMLASWIERRVVGPLSALVEALTSLDSAAPGLESPHLDRKDELGSLARGVHAFRGVLVDRQNALEQVEFVARHDSLTRLPNRMLFDERLEREIVDANAADRQFALLCIDVDRFKETNDTLGHVGGDALLREIADVLRSTCSNGETICRVGGDEFSIIQCSHDQPAAARVLSDRLLAALAARGLATAAPIAVSIGVAIYPLDGSDETALRHNADLALYRAKNAGRGRAAFFGGNDATPAARSAARLPLAMEMKSALAKGEFRLDYQPKMRTRTNEIDSVEALVRWQHPQHGLIAPDDFISTAERIGQIRALTEWTLRQAVADQAVLVAHGNPLPVYVNISGKLVGDADFARTLLDIVRHSSGVMGLEITETAVIDNPENAFAHLHQFVEAGVRVAIDDYGAGMSSLNYLKRLPAHELKIDRAFVSGISRSNRDPLLVRSTIDLAHALGMEVTAEGVETPAALALLSVMGCDLVQGFLIARPMPLAELLTYLASQNVRGAGDQTAVRARSG